MRITIDRSDALKLCMACTELEGHYKAVQQNVIDTHGDLELYARAAGSASMWSRIRENIRKQVDAWDQKHCKEVCNESAENQC